SANSCPKQPRPPLWRVCEPDRVKQIMANGDRAGCVPSDGDSLSSWQGHSSRARGIGRRVFGGSQNGRSPVPNDAELSRSKLVSCLLATGDRQAMVRQALRYFLRQTYDNSELIVVDDGREPVAELCAGICRVKYVRLESPTLLGTKLNIAMRY